MFRSARTEQESSVHEIASRVASPVAHSFRGLFNSVQLTKQKASILAFARACMSHHDGGKKFEDIVNRRIAAGCAGDRFAGRATAS